tara:strand:- start:2865 stop:3353 length:489 start_codon:yes stop_codon:yes gene_type:complete
VRHVTAATSIHLPDEAATLNCGRRLAEAIGSQAVIYLEGDLGAGKTTLCRGILRGLGHTGAVKSPTFTLVEPYELGALRVYHIDLYRLGDAKELEYVGIDDYFSIGGLCLVEWPEKGVGYLPTDDLWIRLEVTDTGRLLTWRSDSSLGEEMSRNLSGSKLSP